MTMWLKDPYRPGKEVLLEFEDAPYTEDRVQAFARLFARAENGLCGVASDYGFQITGRLYAQKEANGLITYEDVEDELFPDPNRQRERLYIRMRELPPRVFDLSQSKTER